MKKATVFLFIVGVVMGCSSNPNTPEHICEVYMTCINAQKWDLASKYISDTNRHLLQISPLLTKNYQYRKFEFVKNEYAVDSNRVRVHSMLIYTDDTYYDSVFLLEKDPLNTWKICSL